MDTSIFGRHREKEIFQKIYGSKEAAFLAVYGRRRVGKTFLIKKYFQKKGIFFHLTGIKDAKMAPQLKNFAIEFSEVFCKGQKQPIPKDWDEAFQLLRKKIELLSKKDKIILFFDELPWLASPRSGFLQALDYCWNRYLSSLPNVILIVCGSAASWMINKVLNNRGGLHGRITHEIPLLPFDFKETCSFLEHQNIRLDVYQLIELYFAIGGVAKYLTYVQQGMSAAQNINALCFQKNSPLLKEFHRLYDSLFSESESHIAIVRALSKVKSGLTYREIAKAAKISTGGRLSTYLVELQTSGFIDILSTFGKGPRSQKYILTDEFSLFYLTWMEKLSIIDLDDHYWIKQQSASQYTAWKGFAFERLCIKHLKDIKKALGISAVITKTSKWSENGAEIDWVIDREDHSINLFEAKFVEGPYQITKAYAENLRNKKQRFRESTHTNKSLFLTMLTPFGVKENGQYFGVVDKQLTIRDVFLL